MSDKPRNPFEGPEIPEIQLESTPLIAVIGQLRIPALATMSGKGFDEFAEKITGELMGAYPLLKREMPLITQNTVVPNGTPQIPILRLKTSDQNWVITISPTFLSIEVFHYSNRGEFASRFAHAVASFVKLSGTPFIERLGVRYINRIDKPEHLNDLGNLIQDSILGGIAIPRTEQVNLVQMFSTSLFEIQDVSLSAKWGILPPDLTPDMSLQPLGEASWVLDLDAFKGELPLETNLEMEITQLAQTIYRFFRWSIKDEFVTTFGGQRNG